MYQWIALGITIIILGLLAVKKPLWLVPLLGVAVALEISNTWYPDLALAGKTLEAASLTKFTSLAIILSALVRLPFSQEMKRKLGAILKDPLAIVLIIYLILGAVSILYSADPGKTVTEALRLLAMFFIFIAIALLVDKEQALLPFKAVHAGALLLAPLALYEGVTGNLIWQGENLLKEHILRVNTTFIDPNIFARFIILGIVANFILQLYTREKEIKLVYLAGLAILLAELMATASRGGVITLFVILIATLILLPNRKAALWVLGLGLLCGAMVLFLRPDMWERMASITQDAAVSNTQRLYLWKAAIAIFKDNLFAGTGLGSFQTVFLQHYIDLKNVPDGATLSHTTILTVAAELGILGLTVLAALWVALLGKLYMLFVNNNHRGDYLLNIFDDSNNDYFVGAGCFLWILTVFISSQGEGRFFEDPILWLSCALIIVLRFSLREYRPRRY